MRLTTVETSSSEVFLLYDFADNDCDMLVKFKEGRTSSIYFYKELFYCIQNTEK